MPCAAGVGHAALTVPPSPPPVYTSQRDSIFTRPVVPASSAPCYRVQCAPQRQENKVNSAARANLGVFPSYFLLYMSSSSYLRSTYCKAKASAGSGLVIFHQRKTTFQTVSIKQNLPSKLMVCIIKSNALLCT